MDAWKFFGVVNEMLLRQQAQRASGVLLSMHQQSGSQCEIRPEMAFNEVSPCAGGSLCSDSEGVKP